MEKIRLGRTNLEVTKTSFGALPIQRLTQEDAVTLVRKAYECGINYFDTANAYSDSEEKLGIALKGVRDQVIISTKSAALDKKTVLSHIQLSLKRLQTDYIDLLQLHNPSVLPDTQDPEGAYAAALEAKEKGYIRHIGITSHKLDVAKKAIESGKYETLQFPFCYLSTQEEFDLVERCKELDIGFIAMKGLSGGLLSNSTACYTFMQQYPSVVPIWGIQTHKELEEWITLTKENPSLDKELERIIEEDRVELAGNFCRSCGYCLPCPKNIDIPQSARMYALLRRAPKGPLLTPHWQEKMSRISNCTQCGACKKRCPYELDIPQLLKFNLKDYNTFI